MSGNKYNYKADLLERLKDLGYAELYLDAAARESRETFFLALRDVAEARKGIAQLAVDAHVNRENLYRILSEEGNPRDRTLESVLNALGMYTTVKLKEPPTVGSNPPLVTNVAASITIGAGATVTGSVDQPTIETPKNSYYLSKIEQEAQLIVSGRELSTDIPIEIAA